MSKRKGNNHLSTPANISIPIIIHGEFVWYHRGGNLNKLKFWHWIYIYQKVVRQVHCTLGKFKNMAAFKLRHCYCNIVHNVCKICKRKLFYLKNNSKRFKNIITALSVPCNL